MVTHKHTSFVLDEYNSSYAHLITRASLPSTVRPRIEYSRVPTSDVEAAPTDSNGEIKHTEEAPHGLTNGDLKRKQQGESESYQDSLHRHIRGNSREPYGGLWRPYSVFGPLVQPGLGLLLQGLTKF